MTNPAFTALERALGAPPPEGLAPLAPEHVQDLADAVHAAHRRQARELAAAGEAALSFVPRLLRGPIKRALS